ncbi:hypothetical protein KR018_000057, partial [Drosophila ironensis]
AEGSMEPEPKPKPISRPKSKRRSSYGGRSASNASGSIGSVSSGLYKAFREKFVSSDESGDYRKLRQRDAEAGRLGASASSSADSSGEEGEPSSSSSVEDLFAGETERRKWQRKSSEQRRRSARGKVS